MQTQWVVGPGGAIGIGYPALHFFLQTHGVPGVDWPEILEGVQILEHETMRLWRHKG